MKKVLVTAGALALIALGFTTAGVFASKPPSPPGQDPCSHGSTGKPCRPDPQSGHGKDCDHHGKKGGVNEDHCQGTTTTPPPPPPPPTTTGTTSTTTTTSTQPTTQGTTTSTTPITSTTQGSTTQSQPTETETTTSASPSGPVSKPKKKTPAVVKIPGGHAAKGHVPEIRHGHAVIRGSG